MSNDTDSEMFKIRLLSARAAGLIELARADLETARTRVGVSDSSPGWKTVCISMYLEDIASMESAVARCKAAGIRRMSRSQLIRIALSRLDVEALITEMRGQR